MIHQIEKCIVNRKYLEGEKLAEQAITQMPKLAVFQNLMGSLLEKENHHV